MTDRALRACPSDCSMEQIESQIGELVVVGNGDGVHTILWEQCSRLPDCATRLKTMGAASIRSHVRRAVVQLEEYFAGVRREFDIPLVLHGTPFQIDVWKNLERIPYGETISYQHLAQQVGGIKKARAVGMANGKNPIPIVVPCHRVIGKNGSLTGFGGGLETKKTLLELETSTLF